MPSERSAGTVVFRYEDEKPCYLLLHYEEGHWGSPKGHIEKEETLEETVLREVREETGLTDIRFISGFKETIQYVYTSRHRKMFKTVIFLLAQAFTRDIKLSFEHTGYAWLHYKEALDKTTFQDEKKILEKADKFLRNKGEAEASGRVG